eukprot:35886-Eustigmatos_ZCMA.PRE.1
MRNSAGSSSYSRLHRCQMHFAGGIGVHKSMREKRSGQKEQLRHRLYYSKSCEGAGPACPSTKGKKKSGGP